MKYQTKKSHLQKSQNDALKNSVKPSIIFLLIGGLLLLISYLVSPHPPQGDSFLSGALSQAAFVLLTVTILNFLWALLGGDPIAKILSNLGNSTKLFNETLEQYNDLLRDSREIGVVRIFTKSDALSSSDWLELLRSTKNQVDLMGYTLFAWTKGGYFEQEALKLLNRGVNIRILIMDEANPHFGSFIERPDLPFIESQVRTQQKHTKYVFENFNAQLRAMNPKPPGSFEMRTICQGLAACHICRTDDKMTVNTNLYSMSPSFSPLIIIQGSDSPMFQSYLNEFSLLWKLNSLPPQTVP